MKPQSPSRFLGASHHLQPWCALVAPYQPPGFELSLANYNRTSPVHGPIPRVSFTTETPLNLHKRFLAGGFLQTAISDTPRTPPEIYLPLHMGRVRYSTSVSGQLRDLTRIGSPVGSGCRSTSSIACRNWRIPRLLSPGRFTDTDCFLFCRGSVLAPRFPVPEAPVTWVTASGSRLPSGKTICAIIAASWKSQASTSCTWRAIRERSSHPPAYV